MMCTKHDIFKESMLCMHEELKFALKIPGVDHKPIYTLRQAFTLCGELLRLKELLKSWEQSVKWLCAQLLAFMKSTPGWPLNPTWIPFQSHFMK